MRTALLVWALLASPALAQTPPPTPTPVPAPIVVPVARITGSSLVPAGCPIILYGEQSTAVSLSWKLITPKDAFLVYDQEGRKGILAIVPTPSPGVYKFALVATGSSVGTFDFDFAEVTVGQAPPIPPPGPTPNPTPVPPPIPPAPTPLARGFIVTIVSDPSAMTIEQATVRDSITIGPAISLLGGRYTTLDLGSKEFTRRNLAPAMSKDDATGKPVSTPAIVIQDAKGVVLSKAPAPATEAAVLSYIKALSGGN